MRSLPCFLSTDGLVNFTRKLVNTHQPGRERAVFREKMMDLAWFSPILDYPSSFHEKIIDGKQNVKKMDLDLCRILLTRGDKLRRHAYLSAVVRYLSVPSPSSSSTDVFTSILRITSEERITLKTSAECCVLALAAAIRVGDKERLELLKSFLATTDIASILVRRLTASRGKGDDEHVVAYVCSTLDVGAVNNLTRRQWPHVHLLVPRIMKELVVIVHACTVQLESNNARMFRWHVQCVLMMLQYVSETNGRSLCEQFIDCPAFVPTILQLLSILNLNTSQLSNNKSTTADYHKASSTDGQRWCQICISVTASLLIGYLNNAPQLSYQLPLSTTWTLLEGAHWYEQYQYL